MKQIILYAALVTGAAGSAVLGYRNVQKNAVIGQHERTIAEQRAMIERLAQQEAIAIHITNEFKSNAVLGKVVVDANVRNAAEQVAAILKGELNNPATPVTTGR